MLLSFNASIWLPNSVSEWEVSLEFNLLIIYSAISPSGSQHWITFVLFEFISLKAFFLQCCLLWCLVAGDVWQSSIFQLSCLLAILAFPVSCPESDQNWCTWRKMCYSFLHCMTATESQSWNGWGWRKLWKFSCPVLLFKNSHPEPVAQDSVQTLLNISRDGESTTPWATCARAQSSSQWESCSWCSVCVSVCAHFASGPFKGTTETLALYTLSLQACL